jgi:hypothetical protein
MTHMSLSSALWILSLLLNSSLLAALLGKGSLRRFPFFAGYAAYTLFANGLLYLLKVKASPFTYFCTYWSNEALGLILGFAVVYEIFGKLLTPYPALRRLALLIFQWSILVLVLMACVVLYAQSSADNYRVVTAVMVLEEATRIIEVGLLMSLFLFSTAFGLHWRQCVFGMALGLGIFATAELVAITMRNFWGPTFTAQFSVVRVIAFNISLLMWTGYLLVPEKEARASESPAHSHLEQWNQALTEFIYQ